MAAFGDMEDAGQASSIPNFLKVTYEFSFRAAIFRLGDAARHYATLSRAVPQLRQAAVTSTRFRRRCSSKVAQRAARARCER